MKQLKNLTAVRREEIKTQADLDNMARIATQHGFDMRNHGRRLLEDYIDGYVMVRLGAKCLQNMYYESGLNTVSLEEFLSYDMDLPESQEQELKTAVKYLQECISVQNQRGKDYDSEGTGERSFSSAARAFNAVTGKELSGSDVCLILTMVKLVRQNSNPARLHEDSLLDGVSYLSLWAEELNKELNS